MTRFSSSRVIALGLGLASLIAFGACDNNNNNNNNNNNGNLPAGIRKFQQAGPNAVQTVRVGTCTRFLPPQGPAGSRVGLGWANGTGASPNSYNGILTRTASFGAVVTAANTANSGTGAEVSNCINELVAARSDASGVFATSGHSQGGSGCINAARRNPRVVTTCQVQPDGTFTVRQVAPGVTPRTDGTCGLTGRTNCDVSAADLKGSRQAPAVIMCGTNDTLAPCNGTGNGNVFFSRAGVPVVKLNVVGATHTGNGSPLNGGNMYTALVAACVHAAGGDPDASAAYQPNGGLANASQLQEVAFRNF